jgi:tetratricopeptide (TPR) repeat protein
MPRHSVSDIAHAAITDHRIMRRPHSEPQQSNAVQPELAAWREPKTNLQKRDLGLAYLQVARKRRLRHMGELGVQVLATEGVVCRNDVTALIELGMETLEEGNTERAAELFRRAMEDQPDNANAAMYLGIAQERAGKSIDAERLFNRSIDQDPSIEEAYFELAVVYAQEGRIPMALATLDRYLLINPQSIGARRAKALLTAERN